VRSDVTVYYQQGTQKITDCVEKQCESSTKKCELVLLELNTNSTPYTHW